MAEAAPMPKCGTCNVKFDTIELMRKHYETDYHLQNVRLRVEGKKPMTQTEYRHSGGAAAAAAAAAAAGGSAAAGDDEDEPLVYSCSLCKKAFRSIQTLQSHVKSTAHLMRKEQRILARDSEAASMLTSTSLGSAAIGLHRRHKTHHKPAVVHKDPALKVSADEVEEDVDEFRCLFCGLKSESVESNLDHLLKHHEFSIPLKHRCSDVQGLMQYLGRKVNGLMCLTCGADTKNLTSLQALRHHMKAADHERIVLTTEYNEFFGNTLDDLEAVERTITDNQLVLHEGSRTVFRRYAPGLVQRHREQEDLYIERKAILSAAQQAEAVMRRERQDLMRPELNRQAKDFQRREGRFHAQQLRVSMKANKLHVKGYDGEGEVN